MTEEEKIRQRIAEIERKADILRVELSNQTEPLEPPEVKPPKGRLDVYVIDNTEAPKRSFQKALPKMEERGKERRSFGAENQDWEQENTPKNYSLKWLLYGGLGILLIIAAGLIMTNSVPKNSEEKTAVEANNLGEELLQKPIIEKEDPELWFKDRMSTLNQDATSVLQSFIQARDDTEKSQFVRNPEFFLTNSSRINMSMSPRIDVKDNQSWNISHTEDKAFVRLVCRDENFLPFSAYFTEENGELKLDVAASSVWSDVSLKDQYNELQPGETAILRCLILRKEEFYSGIYNDTDYASYLLIAADKLSTAWGYVERDSELDRQLKAVLDHGSFLVSLKKNMRVTLKIERSHGAQPSQVDIVELMHEEWVSP